MLKTRLDAVIDRAIGEERIVGTVVLVAEDGQVVYRRAAGLADRENGVPVRDDTVFRFASLTKAIVSVAALALVERGDLRLDSPVTDWIPSFRPRFGDEEQSVITVRHLMTHTSGLTYGFMELPDSRFHQAGVSDGLDQPGLSMEENLRRIASVPLNHTPGTALELLRRNGCAGRSDRPVRRNAPARSGRAACHRSAGDAGYAVSASATA